MKKDGYKKKIWILPLLGAALLSGCQRDKISVYRVPKEAPASPMAMGGEMPHNHPPIDNANAPMNAPMAGGGPSGMPMGNGMGGAELPPGHPPIDGSAPMSGGGMMGGNMPGGDMGGPSDRGVTYVKPKAWTEKPPSQMRVASFSATGKNGQAVDISVVSLSGEAGGDLSNVNRWRGQIGLQPISEDALLKQTKRISPAGRSMLMVDMVSDNLAIDNKYKRRLVAVIHSHGGQSWFFKMIGEDSSVAENKPALLKFLESLKFADE